MFPPTSHSVGFILTLPPLKWNNTIFPNGNKEELSFRYSNLQKDIDNVCLLLDKNADANVAKAESQKLPGAKGWNPAKEKTKMRPLPSLNLLPVPQPPAPQPTAIGGEA